MSHEFPTDRGSSSLEHAFDSPEAKLSHNRVLFSSIAARYDLITRILSFGCDQRWKRRLIELSMVRRGDAVIDLACGTGDLAFLSAGRGAIVAGLDLTTRMLEMARVRPEAAAQRVLWVAGDMTRLPFRAATADVVTTGYGLRNVPDLPAALSEIHRVLKPGGRLCVLDFNRPERALVRGVYLAYLNVVGGALGWILHRDPETYQYIPASIRRYPGARGVVDLMKAAGLTDVRHISVFGGFMAIHIAVRPSWAGPSGPA